MICWCRRRVMYLRKVRTGVRSKHSTMEPVWITCDDLNNEGILVRRGLTAGLHNVCTAAQRSVRYSAHCCASLPGTTHLGRGKQCNPEMSLPAQVSPRMFSQHMPAGLLLTMQRLAKERTGDTQACPCDIVVKLCKLTMSSYQPALRRSGASIH
jgi:hypothetical protein